MTTSPLSEVEGILASAEDTDEALRAVVRTLGALPGATWAGIAFVERGALTPGPESGTAEPARRIAVPVVWEGTAVGELQVDGEVDPALLAAVAALLPAHVLLGWDTAGEAWEP